MKASVIRQFGGPDMFEYCDVNVPSIGQEEVLVRVLACGINHYDLFLREGNVTRDLSFPHVMGADVVGKIEEVGSRVQGFSSDLLRLSQSRRMIVSPGSGHHFQSLSARSNGRRNCSEPWSPPHFMR